MLARNLVGRVLVVAPTQQAERLEPVLPLARKAFRVIDLQEALRVAAPALGIHERAAPAVALVDGALDGVRHPTAARGPLGQLLGPIVTAVGCQVPAEHPQPAQVDAPSPQHLEHLRVPPALAGGGGRPRDPQDPAAKEAQGAARALQAALRKLGGRGVRARAAWEDGTWGVRIEMSAEEARAVVEGL